jgi:hypothetical protein
MKYLQDYTIQDLINDEQRYRVNKDKALISSSAVEIS